MKHAKYIEVKDTVFKIKYASVTIYTYYELNGYTPPKKYRWQPEDKAYSGRVTKHVKTRIKNCIDLFLQISPKRILYNPVTQGKHPFQLSFITLTISNDYENITGLRAYKELLKPFIKWMRETKGITTYVWKAEIQKRGQLHYHITTNEFLHYQEIQHKWNYLQHKAGLLKQFIEKHKHANPNSTDVHSIKNLKRIDLYLSKYLAKSEEDYQEEARDNSHTQPLLAEIIMGNMLSNSEVCYHNRYEINGKVWDCSENLRGAKHFTISERDIPKSNLKKFVQNDNLREFTTDYATILYGEPYQPLQLLDQIHTKKYNEYIASIRGRRK